MKLKILALSILAAVFLVSCTSTGTSASLESLTPLPEARVTDWAKSYFDVHYCTDGDLPLKLTVTLPLKPLRNPTPVLVHTKISPELIRPLVERGFAVVSVDWREPPDSKLPKGIEEVKCAIRYLRANAKQFNIDPNQIGAFGCSRGAHLAAMIGVTDESAGMEGDFGFAEESSRVQAVVMFDGIADFATDYADAPTELEEVHGISSFDDPLVAQLSPITFASPDDPAFLLIASDDEHWQNQAKMLADALTAQGVSATYLQAEGASHCQWALSGPHTVENMAQFIGDFFEQILK
jgi:acetyl esterase/lipase